MISTENSKTFATKLSKHAGQKFERICETLGTNPYNILQQAATSFIKFADMKSAMDPQLRMVMDTFFSNLSQCNNVCSLADPNAKADVLSVILFCGSHKRTEIGQPVMIDEPFCGAARESWKVPEMVERLLELGMPNHYKRMRRISHDMGCNSIAEAIIRLFDDYDKQDDERYFDEMFSDNDRSLFGVKPVSQPFKRRHAKHIENFKQTTIRFDESDKDIAKDETEDWHPIGV